MYHEPFSSDNWNTLQVVQLIDKIIFDISSLRYGSLTFYAPDDKKFPSVNLCYAAGRAGGTMTGVLSAANEKAVEMFVEEK